MLLGLVGESVLLSGLSMLVNVPSKVALVTEASATLHRISTWLSPLVGAVKAGSVQELAPDSAKASVPLSVTMLPALPSTCGMSSPTALKVQVVLGSGSESQNSMTTAPTAPSGITKLNV